MVLIHSRRRFIGAASSATLLTSAPSLADDGAPETATVRLARYSKICFAPMYMVGDLLRAEGFTDIAEGTDWRFLSEIKRELKV
jgi:NitT/TauT family transport system substrate-binding protein